MQRPWGVGKSLECVKTWKTSWLELWARGWETWGGWRADGGLLSIVNLQWVHLMFSQCLSCSDIDVNGPASAFWNNQVHKGLIKWSASYLLQYMKVILFPTSMGVEIRQQKEERCLEKGWEFSPHLESFWAFGSVWRGLAWKLDLLSRHHHLYIGELTWRNSWPPGDWSLRFLTALITLHTVS